MFLRKRIILAYICRCDLQNNVQKSKKNNLKISKILNNKKSGKFHASFQKEMISFFRSFASRVSSILLKLQRKTMILTLKNSQF